MKQILVFLSLFLSIYLSAQQNWCGFDEKLQEQFQDNPSLQSQMYERFDRISIGQISAQDRADPLIIPVVVHVIHDNGIGNVSYTQILSAIDMLNEDFNRLNADTINTRNTANAPFSPIASNMNIQFVLAKKDPNGNCTNGVERRNSAIASYDGNDQKSKFYSGGGLNAWNRNNYFNIWVVNSLESSGGGGLLLGYAQFPNFGAANTYGVILRQDYFGSVGTANGDRTITHEVGHCVGLLHTFQSGCGSNGSNCSNQGDGICDTPPVDEAHWSCSQTQNNCSQIPNGDFYGFDAFDQHENYMSYSSCQNMFSEDQKTVVLANFATIPHMASLTSLSNLAYTGVNQPDVLCKAEFSNTNTIICEGNSIDFADNSFSGITGRNWTFTGGTPNNSLDSSVTITYNTAGVYPVSIEITDGTSTQTETKTNLISVLPMVGTSLPYSEGFENITTFPDNFTFFVENQDDGYTWDITSTASQSGNKSIKMSNYGMEGGSEDRFISGPIDLSVLDASENLMLTFKFAYHKRNDANDEWLKVYVSNDCGLTWSLRKNIHGNNLGTSITNGAYTPSTPEEWTEVTIDNITSAYYVSNFRYKFQFDGDNGNNIYIDNINIFPESWLGTEQLDIDSKLSVYPNPVSTELNIKFMSSESQNLTIDLYNTLGQKINTIFTNSITAGPFNFVYPTANLSNGIYILKINGESISKTIKFSKK